VSAAVAPERHSHNIMAAVRPASSAAAPAEASPPPSLSFEEIGQFHTRYGQLRAGHDAYVAAHPELRQLLTDFVGAALAEKPADLAVFARQHFAQYGPAPSTAENASAGSQEAATAAGGQSAPAGDGKSAQ
jgi:hypothetical protein